MDYPMNCVAGSAPDAVGASIHYSNLAFLAAVKLGVQHVGEFDVSQHRLERARQYLPCMERPNDMTECLIGIPSVRGHE